MTDKDTITLRRQNPCEGEQMTDAEFSAMVLEAFKLQPTGDYHYPLAPNQLRHLVARAVKAEREALEAMLKAEQKRRAALYSDLLDALRLIAETKWVDAALDPQRAVRVARAVIAKAEGRSHVQT